MTLIFDPKTNKWKMALRVIILGIILMLGVFYALKTLNDSKDLWSKQDFRQYWSAGKLLLNNQNPYSFSGNESFQSAISGLTLVTFVPPWAILWLSPLSFLPFCISEFVWLTTNIVFLFVSGYILWVLNIQYITREDIFYLPPLWSFLLFGTFYPGLYCLKMGQASIVLLFGMSLFLYFRRRNNFYISGICLSALLIKPHLFSLLWVGIAYEALRRRNWDTILGIATILLASICTVILLHPSIFIDYFEYVRQPKYVWPENVSIGGFLGAMGYHENSINAPATNASFIPVLIACLFFIIHLKKRKDFSLNENLPIVISLSIFVTPYGWVTDQVLLLFPYIAICSFVVKMNRRYSFFLIIGGLVINASFGFVHFTGVIPEYMFFPVPLLFATAYHKIKMRFLRVHGMQSHQSNLFEG